MPGPESVRGYLDAVEAQIRWKRARTVAARELETHLEDQQEEFLAEGHPPEEAERLAVEDMGDPVAVGADLDRLHRPRPQWGMLGLTLALLLVGGWLRYALTRAGAPWDEDLDPLRCALSVVTGAAVLVGAYFLDVSRLLRWAKWVYIGAVAVGVLSLHLSPTVNNASYFTRYVVLFYPAVYALWLYACRGKGWRGLLAAVAGGIPLTVVCMCAPFIQGMIQVMVIGCFLLLLAIQMDWFTVPRRQGLAAVGGLAAVMTGAVLWLLFVAGYNAARIQILLHPEIDPQGAGYQAVMARRILGASRLMGKGGDLSIQPQYGTGYGTSPGDDAAGVEPRFSAHHHGLQTGVVALSAPAGSFGCPAAVDAAAMCLPAKPERKAAGTGRCPDAGGAVGLCGGAESGLCAVQCPAPSGDGKSPQHGGLRPDRVGAVGLPLRVHFAGRGGSGPAAPANTNSLTRKDKGGEGAPLRPCCMQFVSWPPESGRSGSPPRPRISPLPGPHAPPAPPAAHPS